MAKYLKIAAVVACVLLLVSGMAFASPDPAYDFDSVTTDFTNGAWSLGFQFNVVSTPIEVTTLGFYDDLMNDLTESHEVGIWDAGGNLLCSATVNPGAELVSWFRWVGIDSVVLPVADGYRIAATTGSENYTWDPTNIGWYAPIQYVGDRYVQSNVLAYPVDGPSGTAAYGFFGPNFNARVVPEPGTISALGLMAGGLLAPLFRKLRKG